MRRFDLSEVKKTSYYKQFDCNIGRRKGSLLIQLDKIEKFLQEIEKNITDNVFDCNLQDKIKYTQNLAETLKDMIHDPEAANFTHFTKGSPAVWISAEFKYASKYILEYLFDTRLYLLEVTYLLKTKLSEENISFQNKNKHHLAIAQSLIPSAKSVVSLFTPLLLKEIQADPSLNQLSKENINRIVQESSQCLEDHLYASEKNNATVNQFEGMRQHYVFMLSEHETLFNEYKDYQSKQENAQRENKELLEKVSREAIEATGFIQSLQNHISDQNKILEDKELFVQAYRSSLETQKTELNVLKDTVEIQKRQIEVSNEQIETLSKQVQTLTQRIEMPNKQSVFQDKQITLKSRPEGEHLLKDQNQIFQKSGTTPSNIESNKTQGQRLTLAFKSTNAFHTSEEKSNNDQKKKTKKSIFGFHFSKH